MLLSRCFRVALPGAPGARGRGPTGSTVGIPKRVYSLEQVGEASSSKWNGRKGLLAESKARKGRALSKYEASQSTSKPQKRRPGITRVLHFNGVDLALHRSCYLFDLLPIGTLHPMHSNDTDAEDDPFALQAPARIRPAACRDFSFATSGQRTMTGPHGLLAIATRLHGAPRGPFLCVGDRGDFELDPVDNKPVFVLPPRVRAGDAASELKAFAALAAENVTACLSGCDDAYEVGGRSGACCEFSVADIRFTADFTSQSGESQLCFGSLFDPMFRASATSDSEIIGPK